MKRAVILPLAVASAFLLIGLEGSSRADDIRVAFDVKPSSCPNPINPPGFILPVFPTAIAGTDSLDVGTIDMGSLVLVVPEGGGGLLADLYPISTHIEDVATPFFPDELCECIAAGADGTDDLGIHFDRDALEAALGPREPGEVIQLCISGMLLDGTTFKGCDCVFVVGPTSAAPGTWGTVKSLHR